MKNMEFRLEYDRMGRHQILCVSELAKIINLIHKFMQY